MGRQFKKEYIKRGGTDEGWRNINKIVKNVFGGVKGQSISYLSYEYSQGRLLEGFDAENYKGTRRENFIQLTIERMRPMGKYFEEINPLLVALENGDIEYEDFIGVIDVLRETKADWLKYKAGIK